MYSNGTVFVSTPVCHWELANISVSVRASFVQNQIGLFHVLNSDCFDVMVLGSPELDLGKLHYLRRTATWQKNPGDKYGMININMPYFLVPNWNLYIR